MTTAHATNTGSDDLGFDEFYDPIDEADFALPDPDAEPEPEADPAEVTAAEKRIANLIFRTVADDTTYEPETEIAEFALRGINVDRASVAQMASTIARNSGDDDVALAVEEWLAEWEDEWPTPANGVTVPVTTALAALGGGTGTTPGTPLQTILPPAAAGPILPGSQFGRQVHHGTQAYDDDDVLSNPTTGFAVTFTEDLIGQAKTPEEAAKHFAAALKKAELFVDVLDFTNNTRTQQIIDNPLYYESDGSQPLTEQAVSITMIAGDMELFADETELDDAPGALDRVKEAIAALSAVADTLEKKIYDAAGGPGNRVVIGRDTWAVEPNERWANANHETVLAQIVDAVTAPDTDGVIPDAVTAATAAADGVFRTYLSDSSTPKSGALRSLGLKPGQVMSRERSGKGWKLTNLGANPRPAAVIAVADEEA